jgi:hypothetical protein
LVAASDHCSWNGFGVSLVDTKVTLKPHRGQEVTDDVIDAPYSVVYDQAENRLHIQKSHSDGSAVVRGPGANRSCGNRRELPGSAQ